MWTAITELNAGSHFDRIYDAIIIAITYGRSRQALFKNLLKSYSAEKIHLIDEELIFSEETMRTLGL